MKAQIKLGHIFGIEIGLHYSWVVIAALIIFSLAGYFREANPQWGSRTIWISAFIAGVLFFLSILAHELAHSVVARSRGLTVKSITLFALGGVAQIENEATEPNTEFWMGIVGPISSVVIGIIFLAMALLLGWTPMAATDTPSLAILVWLGYINISLAIFNMIPGFPMDGGRVLRAVIWWVTGSADRSTMAAARAGQIIAAGLIVFGIILLFTGGGFGGLWLALIGLFLHDAAKASYGQLEINELLRGAEVSAAMTRDCPTVDGQTNLQTFAEEFLLRTGHRFFIVVENGLVTGIITPHEVKTVEKTRWPYKLVSDVMRPLNQLRTVNPGTSMTEVLETMTRNDVNQLPVMSRGHLEGIISRGNVLEYLQTHMELNR